MSTQPPPSEPLAADSFTPAAFTIGADGNLEEIRSANYAYGVSGFRLGSDGVVDAFSFQGNDLTIVQDDGTTIGYLATGQRQPNYTPSGYVELATEQGGHLYLTPAGRLKIGSAAGSLAHGAIKEPGEIVWLAAPTVPTGYLLCDGSSYLRTAYPDLFAVIQTTWGAGSDPVSHTTFQVPNLIGRFPVGGQPSGADLTYTVGLYGGEETHTLTLGEMPAHAHAPQDSGVWKFLSSNNTHATANVTTGGGGYGLVSVTDSQGGGGAHENRPPYGVITPLIKT